MTRWSRLLGRLSRSSEGPTPRISEARGPTCMACLYFRNDPADIEAALPGLASLGSGHASVRADDGLCLKHDRFVTARSSCGAFRRAMIGGTMNP